MTAGEMNQLTQRFNQIKGASQALKHNRLNTMLNDLVLAFDANDDHARQMYMAVAEEMEG